MATRRKRRSREYKKNIEKTNVVDFEEARKARREKREETKKTKRKTTIAKSTRGNKPKKTPINLKRVKGQRKRRLLKGIVALFAILTIAFALHGLIGLKIEENRLEKERAELLKEKKQLEKELKDVNTPAYVEEQAREQLNLIMPGEILYVLPRDKR